MPGADRTSRPYLLVLITSFSQRLRHPFLFFSLLFTLVFTLFSLSFPKSFRLRIFSSLVWFLHPPTKLRILPTSDDSPSTDPENLTSASQPLPTPLCQLPYPPTRLNSDHGHLRLVLRTPAKGWRGEFLSVDLCGDGGRSHLCDPGNERGPELGHWATGQPFFATDNRLPTVSSTLQANKLNASAHPSTRSPNLSRTTMGSFSGYCHRSASPAPALATVRRTLRMGCTLAGVHDPCTAETPIGYARHLC